MSIAHEVEEAVMKILRSGPTGVGHAITLLRLGPGGFQEFADELGRRAAALDPTLSVTLGTESRSPLWTITVRRSGRFRNHVWRHQSKDLREIEKAFNGFEQRTLEARRKAKGDGA